MKLVHSNGVELTVRTVSEVLLTLLADTVSGAPLPILPHHILSDDAARALVYQLKGTGRYRQASPGDKK